MKEKCCAFLWGCVIFRCTTFTWWWGSTSRWKAWLGCSSKSSNRTMVEALEDNCSITKSYSWIWGIVLLELLYVFVYYFFFMLGCIGNYRWVHILFQRGCYVALISSFLDVDVHFEIFIYLFLILVWNSPSLGRFFCLSSLSFLSILCYSSPSHTKKIRILWIKNFSMSNFRFHIFIYGALLMVCSPSAFQSSHLLSPISNSICTIFYVILFNLTYIDWRPPLDDSNNLNCTNVNHHNFQLVSWSY